MLLLPLCEWCTELVISGERLVRTIASMRPSNPRNLSQRVGNLSSSFRNVPVSLPELISEKCHRVDPCRCCFSSLLYRL